MEGLNPHHKKDFLFMDKLARQKQQDAGNSPGFAGNRQNRGSFLGELPSIQLNSPKYANLDKCTNSPKNADGSNTKKHGLERKGTLGQLDKMVSLGQLDGGGTLGQLEAQVDILKQVAEPGKIADWEIELPEYKQRLDKF